MKKFERQSALRNPSVQENASLNGKYAALVEENVRSDERRLGGFFNEEYQPEQYVWQQTDRSVDTLREKDWEENWWLQNSNIDHRVDKIRTIVNRMIPSLFVEKR